MPRSFASPRGARIFLPLQLWVYYRRDTAGEEE